LAAALQNYKPDEENVMTDVFDQIVADADDFTGLTTDAGKELSDLIREVQGLDKDVQTAEERFKDLKRKRDRYLREVIPNKMQEIGMDKVEVNGSVVSLSTFVSGTMPKDPLQKEAALNHLRDIGCEDFIKNKITVLFGLSEDNRAKSIKADLEEQGMDVGQETKVEPQTLKKLIKERYESGQNINLEIFNAQIGTIAKIKGN
jgi:hypothetical protein